MLYYFATAGESTLTAGLSTLAAGVSTVTAGLSTFAVVSVPVVAFSALLQATKPAIANRANTFFIF
ncbi:MAG: hypothetical protein ACOVMI_11315 [Chitinophagaceae bacterium]